MNGMNLMVEMVFGLTDNSLYYCNMEILQGNRRKELGGLDAEIVADCLKGAYGNVGLTTFYSPDVDVSVVIKNFLRYATGNSHLLDATSNLFQ